MKREIFRLMDWNAIWYSRPPSYFLRGLSSIFNVIVKLRRYLYRSGYYKTTRIPVPVIVVGNLTVGGTGKTPFVIWLARYLTERGYHPGLISRGYGGSAPVYPQLVQCESDPSVVGDEALLLVQKTQSPVVVAPLRVKAAEYLLARYPAVNVIICDDGLQHYALARDIEIVVIDGERYFGNQYCLPAGPLREPLSRLNEVDYRVINQGISGDGEYQMKLPMGDWVNLSDPSLNKHSIDFIRTGKVVHAVAGIGHPQRFFNALRDQGLNIVEHPFPDHYFFQENDFAPMGDEPIVMTEKDAVKCKKFAQANYWYCPVSAKVDDALGQSLEKRLESYIHPHVSEY